MTSNGRGLAARGVLGYRGSRFQEGAWRSSMGEFSIFHWLIVLAIVLIFFGGRRIPEVMRGLGEGIRSFKDGMSGGSSQPPPPASQPPASNPPQEKK